MRFFIIAALAAHSGMSTFAAAEETEKVEVRNYSIDGRRWVTLFHNGLSVDHGRGSIMTHVTNLRDREYFEVLKNDDKDLTRWTVELGETPGFGPVQSISPAAADAPSIPTFTPWVDVEIHPDSTSLVEKEKIGWGRHMKPQPWRARARPAYRERLTLALGERVVLEPNREPRPEIVRVQRAYLQRVRNSRLTMSLAVPADLDGAFTRLRVELDGVVGEIDLKQTHAIGEILGFSAAGDRSKIYVTTTGLVRYTFDLHRIGDGLALAIRGASEDAREAVLTDANTRRAQVRWIDCPGALAEFEHAAE